MKNQRLTFLLALNLLCSPILAADLTESHLKKKAELPPSLDEYNYYDESQQVIETPEWAPSDTENTVASSQEIPEELAEANQSGSELEEPLSKITK